MNQLSAHGEATSTPSKYDGAVRDNASSMGYWQLTLPVESAGSGPATALVHKEHDATKMKMNLFVIMFNMNW